MNKIFFFLILFLSCAGSNSITISELLRNNELHKDNYFVDLTGEVGFDLNTDEIIPESSGSLYRVLTYLQNHEFKKIIIYSFFVGGGEYGFQSASIRANNIREFLVRNKVDQDKILMHISFEKNSKINKNSIYQPLKIKIEY